jgi:SAM-dependent methyltransferase/ribosomal protein S18 acetylase RimI-like enzyme
VANRRPSIPELELSAVDPADDEALGKITELHMELLGFGPMAGLGGGFVREICYRNHMESGLLWVSLAHIDGKLAGLVAVTPYSATFHRQGLHKHFFSTVWHTIKAIVTSPRRLPALMRALRVLGSRRRELESISSEVGEVVCVAVRPSFLKPDISKALGMRLSELLIVHAAKSLQNAGTRSMRMMVDEENRAALMLYHLMGARFEKSELGGEPMMQVSFDIADVVREAAKEVPQSWRSSHQLAADDAGWQKYWNTVSSKPKVFAAEATDYVRRLRAQTDLQTDQVVLDFGCGFGFVAEELAPFVGHIDIWDYAANVRAQALARTATIANIGYADMEGCNASGNRYDWILVHSVIQYMQPDELRQSLSSWRTMLKPGGRVVISDVLRQPGSAISEVTRLLRFAHANGFLLNAFYYGVLETLRYFGARGARDLAVTPPAELRAAAEAAGFAIKELDNNLSYREDRYSVLLASPSAGTEP